ncbi:MAG TPA: Wzz/FepE/Etk N-terminal domain-containing protein [Bacteroidia bacterium]|nr:Wzz/FepE/Etk N-terminal domain-containing protein [Bacteroidia bacterium]
MNTSNSLEISTLLKLIFNHKKTLIWIIIITAVVSTAISFIIPPKYKTNAVVYPIHLTPYSEESQTEQLLQYFNSVSVRDIVIKKMNLIQHYKIDTSRSDYRSLLNSLYKENVSLSPTLYESIEIEVRDRNPEMTKKIVECIIQTTDSLILALKKQVITEEYTNYQNTIYTLQHQIDSINTLITSMYNQYNIVDQNYQAKYLSKKLSSGKLDADNQKILENIKNKREYINSLKLQIKNISKSLEKLIKEKNRLEVDLKGNLHFVQVISPPFTPDKKYFPVRWIIVSLSELAVISIFIIYLIYRYSNKQ